MESRDFNCLACFIFRFLKRPLAGGGENRVMAEDFLYLDQIDAGLDQVGCVRVAKAVWSDLF